MVDVAKLGLEIDSRQVKTADKELIKFTKSTANADLKAGQLNKTWSNSPKVLKSYKQAIKNTNDQLRKSTRATGFASNGIQQLGFQVQDIAVQLGGGQSPFVVLAQQGSQIASIFGPGGAVIGAILAISGAIAGALLPSLFKADKGFEDLFESATQAAGGIANLTRAQAQFLASQLTEEIDKQKESFVEYGQEVEKLDRQLFENSKQLQQFAAVGGNVVSSLEAQKKRLLEEREEAKFNLATQKQLIDQGNERLAQLNALTGATRRLVGATNELSGAQTALGATLPVNEVEAYFADLAKAEEDAAKARQAAAESQLATAGQLFGTLASIAREGGKEQFENFKALSIAQATVAGALAAIRALAEGGPFLGPALATTIGALTAVQIGKIKQQKFQPRAQGGQVGAGDSFLVGERGPELLTMGNRNGFITSNERMGDSSSKVEVTNVFQISAGVSGTVRAEINAALPGIVQAAASGVTKGLREGGSLTKAAKLRR